jgi:hypothetical protein
LAAIAAVAKLKRRASGSRAGSKESQQGEAPPSDSAAKKDSCADKQEAGVETQSTAPDVFGDGSRITFPSESGSTAVPESFLTEAKGLSSQHADGEADALPADKATEASTKEVSTKEASAMEVSANEGASPTKKPQSVRTRKAAAKKPDGAAKSSGEANEPSAMDKPRAKKDSGKPQQKKAQEPEKDEFGRDIQRLKAARGQGPKELESSSSDSDLDHLISKACPAEKRNKDFEKELKALKKKQRANMTPEQIEEIDNPWLATQVSDSQRQMKKNMFVSFYREQYSRLAKASKATALDTTQYSKEQSSGLKISEGHKPMPRPKNIELPKDYKQPVGVLTPQKLKAFNCESHRMLICIHGDLFDVSDRPDKYAKDGPYWYMAGHDISWGLIIADDSEETLDKYYDIFKIQPADVADQKLQGLMSWWCFYEREYGQPVGRLDQYVKEWGLPPPPPDALGGCSVM